MMKSGGDTAALSRVDALQHSVAMLCKFCVSAHEKHWGFLSSEGYHCALTSLLLNRIISGGLV